MIRVGADENNVQMSDILCDFCHSEWTIDVPMVEGHQGSCICGNCLTIAFSEVVNSKINSAPEDYTCPMCLEGVSDREVLNRKGEPGWQSPVYTEANICRRCIKLAAGTLHKDAENNWQKPRADSG